MRGIGLLSLIALLTTTAAFAQPVPATRGSQAPRSSDAPIDHGPFTPEANAAYQGGGMILQGAPGAPAPTPQPTPPGQTPRNMVQP